MTLSRKCILAFVLHPINISILITALYSIHFYQVLPFSGYTRVFNYETVTTLTSYLIYAREPFSFPLGEINGLTYPFSDANIGNVGALPLFAVIFKALGKVFPQFQEFDYFVFVELLSCFVTALFAQKTLLQLGVKHIVFLVLGALLTGTSYVLLTRSAMMQTFCVVAFPLFMAWIYFALNASGRDKWHYQSDVAFLLLFPIAALLDNYTLFGVLLGTFTLLGRELFEVFFGGLKSSWNRLSRIIFYCSAGTSLSVLALYIIGMFPLPSFSFGFTSYDVGAGGRYHVADLFGPLIPVDSNIGVSLLSKLGFPFSTANLQPGQYEGLAYVGTATLFLLLVGWLWKFIKQTPSVDRFRDSSHRLHIYSPWAKVAIAVIVVFIYSLGYELIILGHSFPNFAGMPAAWISDRVTSLYNLRAPGRLASLLSFFIILSGMSIFYKVAIHSASTRLSKFGFIGVFLISLIHIVEIAPLLKPVSAQALHPIGGVVSFEDVETLRLIGSKHEAVFVAPSVRAAGAWTIEAYGLVYYLGVKSNLHYIARTNPENTVILNRDVQRILTGQWDSIIADYGNVLIAIPISVSDGLRIHSQDKYTEIQIGGISLWSKKEPIGH